MTNFGSRRRDKRSAVTLSADVISAGGSEHCNVIDISAGGAKIEIAQTLERDARVELKLGDAARFPSRVAWKQSPYYGLQFKGDKEKTAETLIGVALYGTV